MQGRKVARQDSQVIRVETHLWVGLEDTFTGVEAGRLELRDIRSCNPHVSELESVACLRAKVSQMRLLKRPY